MISTSLHEPPRLKFGSNCGRYRCLNVCFHTTNCFYFENFFEVPLGSLRWMFFKLCEKVESLFHTKHSAKFHYAKEEQSCVDSSDFVDRNTSILVFSSPNKEEVTHL